MRCSAVQKKFIIGLGGSATNDGGAGMAQALGVRFLDEDNQELPVGGIALEKLVRIDQTQMSPLLDKATFSIACDVSCPLTGKNGASIVFGPQKAPMRQKSSSLITHLLTMQTSLLPN